MKKKQRSNDDFVIFDLLCLGEIFKLLLQSLEVGNVKLGVPDKINFQTTSKTLKLLDWVV